jgi:molybdenum cofactor guanylyltransferase
MGGRAKATLPMGDTSVLGCILRSVRALDLPCQLVGAHESCLESPDLGALMAATGLPLVRDRHPDAGPLAGLDAAFAATDAPRILLLACDLPFLTPDFLGWLLEQAEDESAVPIDANGRRHPLCAVYQATCRQHLAKALDARQLRLQEFSRGIGARMLARQEWARFDPAGRLLTNLNDPADYAAAQQWFADAGRQTVSSTVRRSSNGR